MKTNYTSVFLLVVCALLLQGQSCGSSTTSGRSLSDSIDDAERRSTNPTGDGSYVEQRPEKVLLVAPENTTVFNEEAGKATEIYKGYASAIDDAYDLAAPSRSFQDPKVAKEELYSRINLADDDKTVEYLSDLAAREGVDKIVFSKYSVDTETGEVSMRTMIYDAEKENLREKKGSFYDTKDTSASEQAKRIAKDHLD